jgi:hypothetical protein
MSKHRGKAKRIFNNMTIKRPNEKTKRRKARIKAYNTRQQSNLKAYRVNRQRQKEYAN